MKKPAIGVPGPTVDDLMNLPLSIPSMIEHHRGPMTAKTLALFLGIDDSTIYQRVQNKTIPAFNLDGAVRFDPHTIAAWLRERMTIQKPVRKAKHT